MQPFRIESYCFATTGFGPSRTGMLENATSSESSGASCRVWTSEPTSAVYRPRLRERTWRFSARHAPIGRRYAERLLCIRARHDYWRLGAHRCTPSAVSVCKSLATIITFDGQRQSLALGFAISGVFRRSDSTPTITRRRTRVRESQ